MPGNAAGFCPAWAKISCIFGGNLLDHLVSFSNPSRVTLLSSVTHEASSPDRCWCCHRGGSCLFSIVFLLLESGSRSVYVCMREQFWCLRGQILARAFSDEADEEERGEILFKGGSFSVGGRAEGRERRGGKPPRSVRMNRRWRRRANNWRRDFLLKLR